MIGIKKVQGGALEDSLLVRCVQEDLLVRRFRDAAEEILELQDRPAEHRAGAEGQA